MTLAEDIDLRPYNTFGLSARTAHYLPIANEGELRSWWQQWEGKLPLLVLGGGSNVLLTQDFAGLTLHNRIMGRTLVHENAREVHLRLGAGENWHQCVQYAIANGWGGIENLALIPGTVGAAPMQNIGAYGVELRETFLQLEALDLASGEMHTFDNSDCGFGYRTSVFKRELRGRYIITHVTLMLHKRPHLLNTSYGAVAQELANMNRRDPQIADVAEAVMRIRESKLPDPAKLGNAGSFFKNPVIPADLYKKLQDTHPDIPGWPQADTRVKVPAAWLIEQRGWKGRRVGNTGAHTTQPLVLVNYGGATGKEVWALAQQIQESVQDGFGILLEPEVNVV